MSSYHFKTTLSQKDTVQRDLCWNKNRKQDKLVSSLVAPVARFAYKHRNQSSDRSSIFTTLSLRQTLRASPWSKNPAKVLWGTLSYMVHRKDFIQRTG